MRRYVLCRKRRSSRFPAGQAWIKASDCLEDASASCSSMGWAGRHWRCAMSRSASITVHVPQLAGHCGSSDDPRATRWADWYVTVENEHDRLKARCDTIVVGGLSMGADLALHHAARHFDDISALALFSSRRHRPV